MLAGGKSIFWAVDVLVNDGPHKNLRDSTNGTHITTHPSYPTHLG